MKEERPESPETRQSGTIGSVPAQVEERVLEIVTALTAELQGPVCPVAIGLDQSLARDLSIGSLERVELLVRLEQAFGVRLSDVAMMEAESPRDLARAVRMARPGAEQLPERAQPLGAAGGLPVSAGTLIDALRWHAERSPERVHIFLAEDHGGERPITYRSLWDRAVAVAAGLREHRIAPGDRVALMLRTEEPFFASFFGTLLAGAVAVPMYPPHRADQIEEYMRRQLAILTNAEAQMLVTFDEAERVGRLLRSGAGSVARITTVAQLAGAGDRLCAERGRPFDTALIQYTSGSTGDPKGVVLSHQNLLANIRAIGEALAIGPDDVGVSWLPLYHDMGLIGAWLGALYFGIPITILSPLAFLARPARWLWALHAHRGTISPAPNFAFELCVKRIADDEIRGLDLSAWRLALNGSEPVSPETITRFTRRFEPYGFRPEAMCPTYGLAEASVGLTVSPPQRGPRVEGHSVSCGRPLPGHEVRIVDEVGKVVDERVEGRIEFRGPSVTSGYFRNAAATRTAFHDSWCDSGDLGFRADGELFVTGRRKDIVIKAGRNLHPHQVEELVGDVPGIRKGCVAVFGVPDPDLGTERLVVVAESRETAAATLQRLRADIVDRVIAELGIPPDIVALHGPGTVLKTPSGKIRRSAMRDAYLAGRLGARVSARRQWVRLLLGDVAARVRRSPPAIGKVAYAAWLAVMLSLAFPSLWALVLVLPRGRTVDRATRVWSRVVLALAGCRLRVEGLGSLPTHGAALLVCNHTSYLDVVALLAAIPIEFRFVAKRELGSAPLVGTVIRKAGHLMVDRVDLSRGVADAEMITTVLRRGTSVLFFPEGTFVEAPGLLPFRLGAFKAAVDSQCPVIPIGLHGTRHILPASRWLPRRGAIAVTIGPPITPAKRDWREMVRIRDRARGEIAHAAGEPVEDRR
jgi:1-acyl-sn-glycerol-3-phosphate acyltransferase